MSQAAHLDPDTSGLIAEQMRTLLCDMQADGIDPFTLPFDVDLDAEQCEGLYFMAHRHYQVHEYQEARKLFALMSIGAPGDARGHMGLGACLQMEGEHERACRHYFLASLLDLADPVPAIHSAECLIVMGRHADAAKALTHALTQASGKPEHQSLVSRIQSLQAALATREG